MDDQLSQDLLTTINRINSVDEFVRWIKEDLRRTIPHAVFLGTIGRLLGIGSVATHRIAVDFPMNLVEALKNDKGAIDDPSMSRWFKSGKPSYVNIVELDPLGGQQHWRRTLLEYGIREMTIFGVMDHAARRFVAFQLGNPFEGGSIEKLRLLKVVSSALADAAWRSILARSKEMAGGFVCHPTLGLTATELNIVELLAQGLSNKEIARRRGVSDSTIKTQVQRTGAKLGATRRAEIVAIAMPILSPLPAQSLVDYDEF